MDNFNNTPAFVKKGKQNVNRIESQIQQPPCDTAALSVTWCYSPVGLITHEFTVLYIELQELLLVALHKDVDSSFTLQHALFLATFFLQIKVVFSALVWCKTVNSECKLPHTEFIMLASPQISGKIIGYHTRYIETSLSRVWKLINKIKNNTWKRRGQKFLTFLRCDSNFKHFRRAFFC